MTTGYILDHIPCKMAQLGFKDAYSLTWRNLNLQAGQNHVLQAYNQWVYLPAELLSGSFSVESDIGYLETVKPQTAESFFEHTGRIILQNTGSDPVSVNLIIAVPNCSTLNF